jgi:MoaA/NifB/PqqE/SkfB family radical SAM enzyme
VDLPLEDIESFLDQCLENDVTTISLTGGEPSLHSDFESVVSAIAERSLTCTLVTNGYDTSSYLEMLDAYPGVCPSVAVSLDGPNPETQRRIRGGGFEAAVQAIRAFVARGLAVSVQMLITEDNWREVEDMVDLAANLGVSSLWLAAVIDNPAGIRPLRWEGGRREARIAAKDASRRTGVTVHFASCFLRMVDLMKCRNMQQPQLGINPRGEIVFCCNTSGAGAVLGRLNDKPLAAFFDDAVAVGKELIEEKMRLYSDGHLDDYASNCTFCNAFLADRISNL